MLATAALTLSPLISAQSCACGPTYCTGTSGYQFALSAKKKALAKEHPARLVALFDRIDRCQAAVTQSPDGFSIFRQLNDGSISIDSWTEENEKNGAAAVAAKTLRECRVIVTRQAFECCGSQPYAERPDYDRMLELNLTATEKCAKEAHFLLPFSSPPAPSHRRQESP